MFLLNLKLNTGKECILSLSLEILPEFGKIFWELLDQILHDHDNASSGLFLVIPNKSSLETFFCDG